MGAERGLPTGHVFDPLPGSNEPPLPGSERLPPNENE